MYFTLGCNDVLPVKCSDCMAALLRDSLLINSVALLCSWQFKKMILWSCAACIALPFLSWCLLLPEPLFTLCAHAILSVCEDYLEDLAWQMRSSLNLLIFACFKHVWMCTKSVSYRNPVYPEYTSPLKKTQFCFKTLCWQVFRVWNQICSWSGLCMPRCFYCFLLFYFSFG